MTRWQLVHALWWIGCGGSGVPAQHHPTVLAQADLARARGLAPDLCARAERAAADAARASSAAARDDHEARARLLLAAAVAEAERIELARQAAAQEQQALALEEAAARDEAARVELSARTKRALAAKVAEQEAQRAFAAAQQAEESKLPGRQQRELARKLAQPFFVTRARLLLAAALELGAPAELQGELDRELAAAAAAKAGSPEALAAAQRAHAAALRALGAARGARPEPTAEQGADLLARAAELSVSAQRGEAGVVLALGRVFAPGGAALGTRRAQGLLPLRDLLAAFPHGTIEIRAFARAGSAATARKLAQARGERLRALLSTALPAERLRLNTDAHALGDDGEVDLVLGAYGAAGPTATSAPR